MLPPVIPSVAPACAATAAARPCVPPPADDRYDVARRWVMTMLPEAGAARVLARRVDLGDRDGWEAIGADLLPQYRRCGRVCEALAAGDLDGALGRAAIFCGDYDQHDDDGPPVPRVDEWLRGLRAELARKGGAL